MTDEGYKKLDIYRQAHELAIRVHEMTMKLPRFEMYEEGSQIRRSAKSVSANIVEGYCLRRHKNEFLLYLNRAYASSEETIEHLEILFRTKSILEEKVFQALRGDYESLCKMIFKFIQGVMQSHEEPFYIREDESKYDAFGLDP